MIQNFGFAPLDRWLLPAVCFLYESLPEIRPSFAAGPGRAPGSSRESGGFDSMKKCCLLAALLLLLSISAQAAVVRDDSLPPLPDASNPAAPQVFSDTTPQDKLEIWFGRVSVCDAIVIRCNGETMMIDGGNLGHVRHANLFLDTIGFSQADYLFSTHHHDDHIEAMESLVRRGLLKGKVYLTPYPRDYNVATHKKMQATVDSAGIEYRQLFDGDTLYLGGEENGALFQFFRWDGSTDPNYSSMFCKVTYKGSTILLMADVIGVAQQELARTRQDIPWDADVMKAGHHGYTPQEPALLDMITPELVVIPNSRTGADACVQQMIQRNIPWLVTNGGTIYLVTEGGADWRFSVDRVTY